MRGKLLVGIVSRAKLLHALASLAPSAPAPLATDGVIRERLLKEIEHQKCAPIGFLNVVVRDGVVELWGTISDDASGKRSSSPPKILPGLKTYRIT